MRLNHPGDAAYFSAIQAPATLHPHWIQPELTYLEVAFDMYVWWFNPVGGIEEQAVGPLPQDRGHPIPSLVDAQTPGGTNRGDTEIIGLSSYLAQSCSR